MTAEIPFWGKTMPEEGRGYPLEQHLLDTVAAAQALWDLWLRPGLRDLISASLEGVDARAVVAAVAGLHDIGKANPRFQTQDGRPRRDASIIDAIAQKLRESGLPMDVPGGAREHEPATRRHETVSQHIVSGFPESPSAVVGDGWAGVAVGGHHGQFHGPVSMDAVECAIAASALDELTADHSWQRAREEVIDLVFAAAGAGWEEVRRPLGNSGVAVTLIAGIVIVADWLASSSLNLDGAARAEPSTDWARAYVEERYAEFCSSLPSTLGVYRPPASRRGAVLGDYDPHPLQAEAMTVGRGLWIVCETTGAGKTEAAMLRHMNADESVLWGLPTRATADRMWERVQGMYTGTGNVGALLHAHRALDAFYLSGGNESLTYSAWADHILGNIKPLLSPVAVGTVDQILLGALRQKWTHVRLLALANAHVILDEVHTFDEYQQELVCEVLRWAGATDTRVTMLSASLPQALVEKFSAAYAGRIVSATPACPAHALVTTGTSHVTPSPLVTAREYTLDVDLVPVAPDEMTATVVRHVRELRTMHPAARIAVILNRVDTVIDVGAAIPDSLVLHSRMTAGHRTQVSEVIRDQFGRARTGGGGVVVGTQVIEASLDYDVDFMLTELAPAASLVQRAGRLWRHSQPQGGTWIHSTPRPGGAEAPVLTVLVPGTLRTVHPSAALPYSLGALQRTLTALTPGDTTAVTIAVPQDVQRIVDAAHFDASTGDIGDTIEAAKAFDRLVNASAVIIGARERRGPLSARVTHRGISQLTSASEFAEPATRFTDYEQSTVVLVGGVEGARALTVAQLRRALTDKSSRCARDILARTIPVAASAIGAGKPLARCGDDEFEAKSLRNVIAVECSSACYHPRLGLLLREPTGL